MGLNIYVYRHPGKDCTNGGISASHAVLTVVNIPGPFEPTDERPPVLLVEGPCRTAVIVPAVPGPTGAGWLPGGAGMVGPMSGGNYANTDDGRFVDAVERIVGHHFYGAVPVHDRFETQELADLLSR